ncbi:MAG TPA: magnesium transporter [Thermoanaerobaculia bacterium]|jgi:magnesium transporter|nr:magnesium transporter [Thermoanaerobaculia bacterium]
MLADLIRPDVAELIRNRNFNELREFLLELPVPDLAELLADSSPEERPVLFRLLPRELAAEAFEYLPFEAQEELLKGLGDEQVARVLDDMRPDDRTAFLEELPGQVTARLLNLLSPSERAVARSLLGYPEDSIGRLMTPDYVAVRQDWTMDQVLAHVRRHGSDSETLNVLYVVDEGGKLHDDVRIREVLLAEADKRVTDLMDGEMVALTATDDQETAVAAFRRYDRTALPVVDSAGVLVGIVTVDDVLDVAEEEATEDIQKLGGSEALEDPYLAVGLLTLVRKRASWLVILFLGEMLTATAMAFFEAEIARAVVLALFVPLIISSGGNSGSQAATLIIRALALGEVSLLDWWAIARREVMAGAALGAILGAIGFLRIAVWSAFSNVYGPHWLMIALTVAATLLGVVLWGTLVGSMFPLLLKKLGADPATSSAPFVATLVDVTGLVIYFSVASFLLRGKLL